MKKSITITILIMACAAFFWNCGSDTSNVNACIGDTCVNLPEVADFTVTDSCYWLQGSTNILIYKDGRVTDQDGNNVGSFDLATGTVVMDDGSTITVDLNDLTLLTPEMVEQAKKAEEEPGEEPVGDTSSESNNAHLNSL